MVVVLASFTTSMSLHLVYHTQSLGLSQQYQTFFLVLKAHALYYALDIYQNVVILIVNNEVETVKYYHGINVDNPELVLYKASYVLVGCLNHALMLLVHPQSP